MLSRDKQDNLDKSQHDNFLNCQLILIEPKLVTNFIVTNWFKLKSLIMAQIERWRYA